MRNRQPALGVGKAQSASIVDSTKTPRDLILRVRGNVQVVIEILRPGLAVRTSGFRHVSMFRSIAKMTVFHLRLLYGGSFNSILWSPTSTLDL